MGRSECSKEGAVGRRGKERVGREATLGVRCCGRVRAMADSWGQSQMEAIGSSSPQTSANTDVRHVTRAESSSAEGQYLESIMKGEQEETAAEDVSAAASLCMQADCIVAEW